MLIEQEEISQTVKHLIDGIRRLGNEGAHGEHIDLQQRIRNSEAKELLKLVQYVVGRLYVSSEKSPTNAERLKALTGRVIAEK